MYEILLLDPSQLALQLGSVVKEDVDQALLQLEHCLETFFLILKVQATASIKLSWNWSEKYWMFWPRSTTTCISATELNTSEWASCGRRQAVKMETRSRIFPFPFTCYFTFWGIPSSQAPFFEPSPSLNIINRPSVSGHLLVACWSDNYKLCFASCK